MTCRATSLVVYFSLLALFLGSANQRADAQNLNVNVTTWHQDIPADCTGCVYRTGQNLQESAIQNPTPATFGKYCYYDQLDGQVFGQPLVVTNVAISGVTHQIVVYIVTMNGSVYAFDGQPPVPTSWPVGNCPGPILYTPLITSPSTAASCTQLGVGNCTVIAPVVGILGTPVISANTQGSTTTGHMYVVTESQSGSGSSMTWAHTLAVLDITTLSITTSLAVTPPSGCQSNAAFSHLHIQRPALLLGGDGYLYIAFSMMDGNVNPYPNGMMLAYNTSTLSNTSTPFCLPLSHGQNNADGAGIWGGGGGPAYAPDANGSDYVFFNTGNGVFDLNTGGIDAGDSFIKMANSGSALSISDYYTPGDQFWRSNKADPQHLGCSSDGDRDFGSGAPMIVPDAENSSYPNLAASGDKNGGIWFMDRTTPGGYVGTSTCASTTANDLNVQTFRISSSFPQGPLIHTSPGFWENYEPSGNATSYIFIGASTVYPMAITAGQLLRYQICSTGAPISSSSNCVVTGVAASDSSGAIIFPFGVTPSVSAASASEADAIVWVTWADGSVVPTEGFGLVPAAQPGRLYGFHAAGSSPMSKLYSSEDCSIGGTKVDRINPATKYSVPTVADGHVYLGTQGDLVPSTTCSGLSSTCFSTGTFYVFGPISRSSCQ
jgi:hypothetical protein